VTKEEIAKELVRSGLVDKSKIEPFHDDETLDLIDHYLLYPEGYPKNDEEWEDDTRTPWNASLEEALFLADNCSNLDQWTRALARNALHAEWKLLQSVDPAKLSKEELKALQKIRREFEQTIESDEFD
jgi:hypothetical protein